MRFAKPSRPSEAHIGVSPSGYPRHHASVPHEDGHAAPAAGSLLPRNVKLCALVPRKDDHTAVAAEGLVPPGTVEYRGPPSHENQKSRNESQRYVNQSLRFGGIRRARIQHPPGARCGGFLEVPVWE